MQLRAHLRVPVPVPVRVRVWVDGAVRRVEPGRGLECDGRSRQTRGMTETLGMRRTGVTERTSGFKRMRRAGGVVGLGLVMAAALAGCAGSGGYAVIDAEPVADSPALPELPDYAFDNVDESTLRYAGDDDGTALWLGVGTETATMCLLVYPNETGWMVSCGGDVGPLEMSTGGSSYRLQPDGMPVPDGWTAVSENVLTRGN